MDLLKRTISLILVFQLCWACNGGSGGSSGVVSGPSGSGGDSGSGDGETINIQGTIGSVFHSLSETLLSSAFAQDGQMEVFDITDPTASPKSLGIFDVQDESSGYSIDLPADEVQGALIKLKYLGKAGEREMILNVDPTDTSLKAEVMDTSNFVKSKILEAHLQQEVRLGFSTVDILRTRFKELDANKADIDDDLSDFENIDAIKKIIQDPDKGKELADYIAQARIYSNQGESQKAFELKAEAFDFAYKADPKNFEGAKFVCGATKARFFFRGEGSYQVKAVGLTKEVLNAWRGLDGITWDQLSNSPQVNQVFFDIITKMQMMSKGQYDGKLLAARVTIIDLNGKEVDRICDLYSRAPKEGEETSTYINLDQMNDLDKAVEIPLRDRQSKLYEIYRNITEQARVKIWDGVAAAEFDEVTAQKLFYSQMLIASKAFNDRIDAYQLADEKSAYSPIELDPMRGLSCSSYGNLEEFNKSLKEVYDRIWNDYNQKAKDAGLEQNEEFYTRIDALEMTQKNLNSICSYYDSISK